MDKQQFYRKYYKTVKRTAISVSLIFFLLLFPSSQDKIADYGIYKDTYAVIELTDQKILVYDLSGNLERSFSATYAADEKRTGKDISLTRRDKAKEVEIKKSFSHGVQKVSLYKEGKEIVLFQTERSEYIIKFFLYFTLVMGFVAVTMGAIRTKYLE